jgi:uncharacterized membrane protein
LKSLHALMSSRLGRVFAAAVTALTLATVVGLVALWPDGSGRDGNEQAKRQDTVAAEVTSVTEKRCVVRQESTCATVSFEVKEGEHEGETGSFPLSGTVSDPDLSPGDSIRVIRGEPPPPGTLPPGTPAPPLYSFADFDRGSPMLWLAIGFVVIVLIFGRLRGGLSLIGLLVSLAIVVGWIVPAILDGRPPLLAAVIGSFAVMLATITLAHGLGPKGVAALLGTAAALGLTVALAAAFTSLASITGQASEESLLLQVGETQLSLEGLVRAGMVIGALGVLDDVTVSQASAVMALRRANPAQTARELYQGALAVGRDHVAATVNTLVLAYAGASLPVLLLFSVGDTPFSEAVNNEAVAANIVATLVGSIGLIAAVPLTTGLAALLAVHLAPDDLESEGHAAHAH